MARGEGEQMTAILPLCDNWEQDGRNVDRAHRGLEKRAIKAEAEVARLRREVAWLRSEPKNLEGWFIDGDGEVFDYAGHLEPRSITCEEWSAIANRDLVKLRRHIDSSPPEGWETA